MSVADWGGKAHNLKRLQELGLPVPAFAVVPASVFTKWRQELLDNPKALAKNLELRRELQSYIPEGTSFAVRSSGTEEDGAAFSFAGQFESYLEVPPALVVEKIIACWQSRFTDRARAYIETHGLDQHSALAVIIQRMISSDKAGVMITANPDFLEPFQTVISAGRGLGEGVVSGEVETDTYVLSQSTHELLRGQLQGATPILTKEELRSLSLLGRTIEKAYGGVPQDIEWCFKNGELFVLQTRPLTSWSGPVKTTELELWDSSNIGESYHGAVSPMTFSFTRENYQNLFTALLRDLGATEVDLEKSRTHLCQLLGQHQGHLYYRLTHWKELLAPLPGGALFMRLLGPFIGSSTETGERPHRTLEALRALGVVRKIFKRYLFRHRYTQEFERRYEAFRRKEWRALEGNLSEHELKAKVLGFYEELFEFWLMPTYNDFFSVMWTGAFEAILKFAYKDRTPAERSELRLTLVGAAKGLGPVVELKKLTQLVKANPAVLSFILNTSSEELARLWDADSPEFAPVREAFARFLADWGFRCEDELLLEATDLLEAPGLFFEQLKLHLTTVPRSIREEAPVVLARNLREKLASPLVRFVAMRTKEHLETRESMRIKRSELFALMRRYLKRLGSLWQQQGILTEARDIFRLELPALRRMPKEELKAALRSWEMFETAPARFYQADNQILVPKTFKESSGGISGTPCFGGLVTGEVVIYHKGMSVGEMKGKILCTERSGPGHVTYFPHILAMIVEKGSTLSHAVIAAREFGLPTVVGVEDVCEKLAGAGTVSVDANTGEIKIIS